MALPESVMAQESRMTREEFEADYAATAGTTVDALHATGRAAERCWCDWDLCRGWALGYRLPSLESGEESIGLPD